MIFKIGIHEENEVTRLILENKNSNKKDCFNAFYFGGELFSHEVGLDKFTEEDELGRLVY